MIGIDSLSNNLSLNQIAKPTQGIADVQNRSFDNMLKKALLEVNETQVQGYDAMQSIANGSAKNLQEAVQRIEEAELSLKLALEVKNKAINSLREITKMQI
ncbi:MAG: flagellar hook-basal body complex protein FliE [Arcobacter butzleri]|jgi:flagellar hook-basal body complex protein FliE|nr:flagellar hook-basal body complex protein FliE [Arcobacteraceae bacterium]MDY0365559.1 flagellar hook-basal body complex protein FliE [Arcobacteraceae bacterium]NLO16699.1 flagellar hook-basal body complex protein FliE [Aliarcobacter butzleri]